MDASSNLQQFYTFKFSKFIYWQGNGTMLQFISDLSCIAKEHLIHPSRMRRSRVNAKQISMYTPTYKKSHFIRQNPRQMYRKLQE